MLEGGILGTSTQPQAFGFSGVLKRVFKPCPSPAVEFHLRANYRFRAGLGMKPGARV